MTKIIELAHALGEEIARSAEIENLEVAKAAFSTSAPEGIGMRAATKVRSLVLESVTLAL